MDSQLCDLFTSASIRRLEQFSARIATCVARLPEEQIWARGSANENAVGNLMLHLAGNVRQWILSGVGGEPDRRQRDAEFTASGGISGAEMLTLLQDTVRQACAVIGSLTPAGLAQRRNIQGYDVSVLEAVLHVVEHFALHTGQIIFATKLLTHEDLGFYKHLSSGAAPAHGEKTP